MMTPCLRCGVPCRIATEQAQNARLMRNSLTTDGHCVNCAMTYYIRFGDGFGLIPWRVEDRRLFEYRGVQEAIERLLIVGNSDARPGDIDWSLVVKNWELPFENEQVQWRPSGAAAPQVGGGEGG